MEEKSVLLAKNAGIATITLNRPAAMNSLNQALTAELAAALADVRQDASVRVVVLTGNGKAFCAGGDLNYLASLDTPAACRDFISQAGANVEAILNLEKPVIAMVNGVAAGAGFNIALACDLVFCASTVKFAQSFSKVGLVPDCGGLFLLPRLIGLHKAKELMFTADLIDAAQALALGLVNQVVEPADLAEATFKFAERLAAGAPLALGMIKKMVNRSDSLDLPSVLACEADLQTICMQTADYREGVAAFKEKRPPRFTGR